MLAPIGDKTVVANSTLQVDITATDADDNPLTFSLAPGDHDWAALVDHGDGSATLTLSPGTSDVGLRDLTITVSDGIHQDAETISVDVITGIALRGSAAAANTGGSEPGPGQADGHGERRRAAGGDHRPRHPDRHPADRLRDPGPGRHARRQPAAGGVRARGLRRPGQLHLAPLRCPRTRSAPSTPATAASTPPTRSWTTTARPARPPSPRRPLGDHHQRQYPACRLFGITGKTGLTPPATMTEQREIAIQKEPEKLTAALADEAAPADRPHRQPRGHRRRQRRQHRPAGGPAPVHWSSAERRADRFAGTAATDQDASVGITLTGHDSESCQLTFSIA